MRERSALEVLLVFLKLGLTSFGGPVAHLGYFRAEFVVKRQWLDDQAYTDLVALCHFLPGPSSSQVAFALGLIRAGCRGSFAAWCGFTLPSAVLLTAFAYGSSRLNAPVGHGVLHGLQLIAVAIVAQAVGGMSRSHCPDLPRAAIACVAAIISLSSVTAIAQIVAIMLGAVTGGLIHRPFTAPLHVAPSLRVTRTTGFSAVVVFIALLLAPIAVQSRFAGLTLFDAFYRSGALVFGGGHVVLPLLSRSFVGPGWISENAFLAGYGAAQAVPGPLFTFAAYLGALSSQRPNGIAGAVMGVIAIFLPGVLILVGILPFWSALTQRAVARAAMNGVNAAVVGILSAALYDPLWTFSVHRLSDALIILAGFVMLTAGRVPAVVAVAFGALSGAGQFYSPV